MIDTDAHYKVDGYGGIAWYCLGPVKVRDEDYEWSGMEYDHDTLVQMVMVGDDRVFEVDKADLTVLAEEDFCHVCGQIGCTHDGLER